MIPAAGCSWREDDRTGDWQTACGNRFVLFDKGDSPIDLRMSWCCYCGGLLTQISAPYYPEAVDDAGDRAWLRDH